jgi:orotidine-5'-phosphate decarboxylase
MKIRDYAILLAVDTTDESKILRLLSSVGSLVDGVKVGIPTLLGCGTQIVRKMKSKIDGPVVADLKVADIGFRKGAGTHGRDWSGTNSKIIEVAIGAGIDYVICHTIVGTSSIRECVDVAHSLGGKIITLPYMTHEGAGLFFDQPIDLEYTLGWLGKESPGAKRALVDLGKRKKEETGWRSRGLTTADLILVLGEEYGVDGYVAPANMPKVMSDCRRMTDRFLLAPGIGRQGGKIGDVYRILGPKSAAAVGTAIYGAEDPIAVCKELLLERDRAVK